MCLRVKSGSGLRSILTVGLAYALALQAIIGALASVYASANFDVAEHSLCSPNSADGSSQPGGTNQHTGPCIFACGFVSVGVQSAAPSVFPSEQIWTELVAIAPFNAPIAVEPSHPFEARAPPSVLV